MELQLIIDFALTDLSKLAVDIVLTAIFARFVFQMELASFFIVYQIIHVVVMLNRMNFAIATPFVESSSLSVFTHFRSLTGCKT